MGWFFESAFKFIFSLEESKAKHGMSMQVSLTDVKTSQLLFSMCVGIFPIYLNFGLICFKIIALAWCPVSLFLPQWLVNRFAEICYPFSWLYCHQLFFQLNLSTQVRIVSKFSLSLQISHIKWTILKSVSSSSVCTEIVTIFFPLYLCLSPFPSNHFWIL